MHKINEDIIISFFFITALSIAAYLSFAYASYPPLDVHAFRQSQTALTSYWFIKEGYRIDYQTPVAGSPWSIPFEFPLYQFLVAITSDILQTDLNATGRITSFLFLLGTLIPAYKINKSLKLSQAVFITFGSALFTSPIYLYWGRAFMIETTAVFLVVSSIACILNFITGDHRIRHLAGYTAFSTVGMLQKATTALPTHAIMTGLLIAYLHHKHGKKAFFQPRNFILVMGCGLTPLLVGFLWVGYTDSIKSLNPLGRELTSAALKTWNWGTLNQRFSMDLYARVLYLRIFHGNIGGPLGIILLSMATLRTNEKKARIVIGITMALGLLPLFLFTPLHIEHDYYQTANVIYLLYATSLAITLAARHGNQPRTANPTLVIAALIASNYFIFYNTYLPAIIGTSYMTSQDHEIGLALKRELPSDEQFVSFGNEWSSTLAYISERKSFSVPRWFKDYENTMAHPEKYVEPGKLGAVTYCNATDKELHYLLNWSESNRGWKVGLIHDCYLATMEKAYQFGDERPSSCKATINLKEIQRDDNMTTVVASGWIVTDSTKSSEAENLYIKLQTKNRAAIRLQALSAPALGQYNSGQSKGGNTVGFSRVLRLPLREENPRVTVTQINGGTPEECDSYIQNIVRDHTKPIHQSPYSASPN